MPAAASQKNRRRNHDSELGKNAQAQFRSELSEGQKRFLLHRPALEPRLLVTVKSQPVANPSTERSFACIELEATRLFSSPAT
eukprot:scaffold440242_cov38-Prasinocladus_malaysianus.AAC.1